MVCWKSTLIHFWNVKKWMWINSWSIRNHMRLIRPLNDLKRRLKQISLLTSEKPKWDYPLIQICFIWHTRLLLEPCLHFFWRSVYGSVAVGKMTLMNSIRNRKFSMNLRLTLGYSVSSFKFHEGSLECFCLWKSLKKLDHQLDLFTFIISNFKSSHPI